jgi:FtsZ-binding cell division protein ZapB
MDYDELVGRLTFEAYNKGLPPFDGWEWLHEAANAIVQLQARVEELGERNEQLQVQLAGCGVAALQNTRQSIAEQRIGRDQYGFSGSYEEVCNAVDREIDWRERAERAESDLAVAKADRNTYDSAHKLEAAAHLRTMADLAAARALLLEVQYTHVWAGTKLYNRIASALAAGDKA